MTHHLPGLRSEFTSSRQLTGRGVKSVTAACSWTTQLTATSCTTEMKTQTTYMMLSRCVTPLTESHFSRYVWHFSSLYSVHHTAFAVFDDIPSI